MFLGKDTVPTNVNSLIGKTGIVTADITETNLIGQVRVGREIWSAVSENEISIPKDTQVEILNVDGVKLVVTPIKNFINK